MILHQVKAAELKHNAEVAAHHIQEKSHELAHKIEETSKDFAHHAQEKSKEWAHKVEETSKEFAHQVQGICFAGDFCSNEKISILLWIEKTNEIVAQTKEAILTGEQIAEEKLTAAKQIVLGGISLAVFLRDRSDRREVCFF